MTTIEATQLASRHHRNMLLNRFGLVLCGVAIVIGTACSSSSDKPTAADRPVTTTSAPPAAVAAAETEARPSATIDELVGIEGGRLHVRCTGDGDATVLLIAGFGGDETTWAKVEPAISSSARVCSYARFGTGTSDPPASTQTFSTEATDLRSLLTTIGEPGPFVVVGHSFGGGEAVTFASMFADEVEGLVLVDASPVTWPAAICSVPDDGSDGAAMLQSVCAAATNPDLNPERLDAVASFAAVGTIDSLGSLPMTVITAADSHTSGLNPTETARLEGVWAEGQQAWSELSTAATVVTVNETSHDIQLDRPDDVIREITRLLP